MNSSDGLGAVRLVLSYIPSPGQSVVQLGPLQLRAYGLMLAIGVLAATKIAARRWKHRGGDPKIIGEIVVPVVIGGVIGARLYHLFTGYRWSRDGVAGAFEIWRGGLSIWGAVAGGLLALIVVARIKHLDALALADAIAPGVAIAQAIGRWGNWFNQELFGRPTGLPWALEIDRLRDRRRVPPVRGSLQSPPVRRAVCCELDVVRMAGSPRQLSISNASATQLTSLILAVASYAKE